MVSLAKYSQLEYGGGDGGGDPWRLRVSQTWVWHVLKSTRSWCSALFLGAQLDLLLAFLANRLHGWKLEGNCCCCWWQIYAWEVKWVHLLAPPSKRSPVSGSTSSHLTSASNGEPSKVFTTRVFQSFQTLKGTGVPTSHDSKACGVANGWLCPWQVPAHEST